MVQYLKHSKSNSWFCIICVYNFILLLFLNSILIPFSPKWHIFKLSVQVLSVKPVLNE